LWNKSKATRGRVPRSWRASWAVEKAMSASCSTVGSGMTPAIRQEHHGRSAEARVFHFHNQAARSGVACGATFDDLKERPQVLPVISLAAGTKPSAWCIAPSSPVIIRVQHRWRASLTLMPL